MLTHLKPVKQRDPDKVLALMGCMVGPRKDALSERFPYVDVFMQPQQYDPLIELLGDRLGVDPEGCVGPLSRRPQRLHLYTDHSWLRQVLLLLHHPLPAGQGDQQKP